MYNADKCARRKKILQSQWLTNIKVIFYTAWFIQNIVYTRDIRNKLYHAAALKTAGTIGIKFILLSECNSQVFTPIWTEHCTGSWRTVDVVYDIVLRWSVRDTAICRSALWQSLEIRMKINVSAKKKGNEQNDFFLIYQMIYLINSWVLLR